MQYTTLGHTGLVISRLTLGTMTFGEGSSHGFDHPVDQAKANALVSQALDAGINFFDTADIYSEGLAETFLAKALGKRRQDVIISTKIGGRTGSSLTDAGLSYRHVISATEASLKRLNTDYIDLLHLHVPDPITPFDEIARALEHLVQRGLVRYIGYSNFGSWQAEKILSLQKHHNYSPFISAQLYYSLLGRDLEHDAIPFLEHEGLGLMVWSPLAGGFLTGKYRRDTVQQDGRLATFDYLGILQVEQEFAFTVVAALQEIANAHEHTTIAQVALAWLLARRAVSTLILGANKAEQLAENLAAVDLQLTDAEKEKLDALTTPRPLYPYSWRASQGDYQVRQALYK